MLHESIFFLQSNKDFFKGPCDFLESDCPEPPVLDDSAVFREQFVVQFTIHFVRVHCKTHIARFIQFH